MEKYYILKNNCGERIVVEAPIISGQNVKVHIFKLCGNELIEYTPTISIGDLKKIIRRKGKGSSSYEDADYFCVREDLRNEQRKKLGKPEKNKITYYLPETIGIDDDDNLIERIKLRNASYEEIKRYITSYISWLDYGLENKYIKYNLCSLITFVIIVAILISNSKFGFQEFINLIETYPKLSALTSLIGVASVHTLIRCPEEIRELKDKIENQAKRVDLYQQDPEKRIYKTSQKSIYENPIITVVNQSHLEQAQYEKEIATTDHPKLRKSTANLSPKNLRIFLEWLSAELQKSIEKEPRKLSANDGFMHNGGYLPVTEIGKSQGGKSYIRNYKKRT